MRIVAQVRRVGSCGADYTGAGQRPLSTEHRGAGVGDEVGDYGVDPAVRLAEPELDRTVVEVHQTSRALRSLPSDLRRVSGRHPRGPRRSFDEPRRKPEVTDDAQFPAI